MHFNPLDSTQLLLCVLRLSESLDDSTFGSRSINSWFSFRLLSNTGQSSAESKGLISDTDLRGIANKTFNFDVSQYLKKLFENNLCLIISSSFTFPVYFSILALLPFFHPPYDPIFLYVLPSFLPSFLPGLCLFPTSVHIQRLRLTSIRQMSLLH